MVKYRKSRENYICGDIYMARVYRHIPTNQSRGLERKPVTILGHSAFVSTSESFINIGLVSLKHVVDPQPHLDTHSQLWLLGHLEFSSLRSLLLLERTRSATQGFAESYHSK